MQCRPVVRYICLRRPVRLDHEQDAGAGLQGYTGFWGREITKMHSRFLSRIALAIVGLFALASTVAYAQPTPPDLRLRIDWSGNQWNSGPDSILLCSSRDLSAFTGQACDRAWGIAILRPWPN